MLRVSVTGPMARIWSSSSCSYDARVGNHRFNQDVRRFAGNQVAGGDRGQCVPAQLPSRLWVLDGNDALSPRGCRGPGAGEAMRLGSPACSSSATGLWSCRRTARRMTSGSDGSNRSGGSSAVWADASRILGRTEHRWMPCQGRHRRPSALERVYPVMFIDAIHVKIRMVRSPAARSMSPSASLRPTRRFCRSRPGQMKKARAGSVKPSATITELPNGRVAKLRSLCQAQISPLVWTTASSSRPS